MNGHIETELCVREEETNNEEKNTYNKLQNC